MQSSIKCKIFQEGISSLAAGILIALGGTVFLVCKDMNDLISYFAGVLLFSTALFCICTKGYALFTGRVGYLIDSHKSTDILRLSVILVGNILMAIFMGMIISTTLPGVQNVAIQICNNKLGQSLLSAILRGFLCGILVHLAVDIYKQSKSIVGIFTCVPLFILCGFEHSIADVFYFSVAMLEAWEPVLYILLVIIGNGLGALLTSLLSRLSRNGGVA